MAFNSVSSDMMPLRGSSGFLPCGLPPLAEPVLDDVAQPRTAVQLGRVGVLRKGKLPLQLASGQTERLDGQRERREGIALASAPSGPNGSHGDRRRCLAVGGWFLRHGLVPRRSPAGRA